MTTKIRDLGFGYIVAPPDATVTTSDDPRRCWMCAFYSFKIFANENETSGKCFLNYDERKRVYWVDGLMTCPSFKKDEDS